MSEDPSPSAETKVDPLSGHDPRACARHAAVGLDLFLGVVSGHLLEQLEVGGGKRERALDGGEADGVHCPARFYGGLGRVVEDERGWEWERLRGWRTRTAWWSAGAVW